MATQRGQRNTQSEATPSTDDLGFEEATWPSKASQPPNPAMVAKLRESWDAGVVRNGRRECKPFAIRCADEDTVTLRTRQLRYAAQSLGYGVAIKTSKTDDGAFRLIFRARQRRKTRASVSAE